MSFWEDVEDTCKPKMRAKDIFEIDQCVDDLAKPQLVMGKCPFGEVDRLKFEELRCAFRPKKGEPEKQLLCVNKALQKSQKMIDTLNQNADIWNEDRSKFEKRTKIPYSLEVQKIKRCIREKGRPEVKFYRTEIPKFPGMAHFMGWDGSWDKMPKEQKVVLLDEFINAAHMAGELADFVIEGGQKTLERLFGE